MNQKVYLPGKDGKIAKINFDQFKTSSQKRLSETKNKELPQKQVKAEQPAKIETKKYSQQQQQQNSLLEIPFQDTQKIVNTIKLPFFCESYLVVSAILEGIIYRTEEKIKRNNLKKMLPLYNAVNCVWLCEQLANFQKYPQDNRQPWMEWIEDKEPSQLAFDSRQTGSIKVSNWVQQVDENDNNDHNFMSNDLEILLAQPKLYFKVPEKFKALLQKKNISPIESVKNRSVTEASSESGDANSYTIQYKINRSKGDPITYKAPLYPSGNSFGSPKKMRPNSPTYQPNSVGENKERHFVRKILKREAVVRVINTSLQQYKEEGQISVRFPEQMVQERTHSKYLKKLQAESYHQVKPLNLHKNIPMPEQVKLIDVPRKVVELDFKQEARSMSPYYRKHEQLLNMNQELFLKKDYDNFSKKVFDLAKKKHINMNFMDDRTKPSKKPMSPRLKKEFESNRVYTNQQERYERIQELISGSKLNYNYLPEKSVSKYKFPQKL